MRLARRFGGVLGIQMCLDCPRKVLLCRLRDVSEVSGGSPSENVVFARRFGGVRGILANARMCRLRDVSEVFL
jgi:hypothetical protein